MSQDATKLVGLIIGTLCLGGCALDHRTYGTTWTADLQQPPDLACAHDAIASLDQVWRVDADGNTLGVFIKGPGKSAAQMQAMQDQNEALMRKAGYDRYRNLPEINLNFAAGDGKPAFRMNYMGWLEADDYREVTARAIIEKLSATCHLAQGASEKRDSIATPALFAM